MIDDLLSIVSNNGYYLYHRKNRCFYISDKDIHNIMTYLSENNFTLREFTKQQLSISEISVKLSITYESCLKKINYIKECADNLFNHEIAKKVKLSIDDINKSIANIKQIIIEVTEKCNLNCYYCCYGKLYNNNRSNININNEKSFKAIENIIEFIKSPLNDSVHSKIVVTFYGGEPLVNIKYIKRSIEYFESQITSKVDFSYSMTTNGVLLNENIDYLYDKNIKINISLDGDREGNSYRVFKNGERSYDKIWENLNYVKLKYPSFYEENISFISVLHDKNSLISLYKYFGGMNKQFYYSTLHKTQTSDLSMARIYNSGEVSESQLDNLKNEFPELFYKIESEINNIEDYITLPLRNEILFYDKVTMPVLPSNTCFLFHSKIFLTASGLLLPCEKADLKFSFGSYDCNGLKFDLNKIERIYNVMLYKYHNYCSNCYDNANCGVCYFTDPQAFDFGSVCHANKLEYIERITSILNNNEKIIQ